MHGRPTKGTVQDLAERIAIVRSRVAKKTPNHRPHENGSCGWPAEAQRCEDRIQEKPGGHPDFRCHRGRPGGPRGCDVEEAAFSEKMMNAQLRGGVAFSSFAVIPAPVLRCSSL